MQVRIYGVMTVVLKAHSAEHAATLANTNDYTGEIGCLNYGTCWSMNEMFNVEVSQDGEFINDFKSYALCSSTLDNVDDSLPLEEYSVTQIIDIDVDVSDIHDFESARDWASENVRETSELKSPNQYKIEWNVSEVLESSEEEVAA